MRVVAVTTVALVVVAALLVSPAAALERVHALLASPWFPLLLVALYALRPLFAWPITVLSALCGYRYGLVIGLPVAL